MGIFPKKWQGRTIDLCKLPKHYIKDGKVYETRTNKLVDNTK